MMSPLRHALAAADRLAVRHLGHFEAGDPLARREQQLRGACGVRSVPLRIHSMYDVLVFDVAHQNHAVQPVVLQQQLLVHAQRRVFIADHFDARLGFVDSRRPRRYRRP